VTMAAPARTGSPLAEGASWVSHREAAAMQGEPLPDCDGRLRVADVCGPELVRVECDSCPLVLGVRPAALRRATETRPSRWWDK
jgi:hypothetical protein